MEYRFNEQLLVFFPSYGGIVSTMARISSTIVTRTTRIFPIFSRWKSGPERSQAEIAPDANRIYN